LIWQSYWLDGSLCVSVNNRLLSYRGDPANIAPGRQGRTVTYRGVGGGAVVQDRGVGVRQQAGQVSKPRFTFVSNKT
jgi:hypothetical protein